MNKFSRDHLAALSLIYCEQLSRRRNRPVLHSADIYELISQGAVRGLDDFLDQPNYEWRYHGILGHLNSVIRVRGVSGPSSAPPDRLVPSWSNFLSTANG